MRAAARRSAHARRSAAPTPTSTAAFRTAHHPVLTAASPTPVGRFGANAFGLFDMSGNVWEWTQDEHCPYPSGAVTDPVGECGSDRRVIRGGSWAFDGGSARCGVRFTHRPQDKGYSLGLRLAHDLF